MDKELLKDILSVPSHSRSEDRVIEYIVAYAKEKGIECITDKFGNVFLKKGEIEEGQGYPCVVAHMDTVHRDQAAMVNGEDLLIINETTNSLGTILYAQRMTPSGVPISTGIGGDDKAGVFIALSLIDKFDVIMGAFFVEEEIGCNGSRNARHDVGDEWLKDAAYFMQFDAPTDDWTSRVCSGVELFNDEVAMILKPVWETYNLSAPHMGDPFTDVKELRLNYPVCCINYFAGYMDMHSAKEYVVVEFVEKAINVGASTIIELGKDVYLYDKKK
jgi:di/tripeptidase